jgi:hypothetical protein
MAFGTHSTVVSAKRIVGEAATGLHLNWGERIVTVVAACIAVLIVATIAVLLGTG